MNQRYVQGSTPEKEKENIESRQYYREAPIKKTKQKTVQWTPLYVIMLSGIAILFMFVVMRNIQLNSEINALRNQKGNLTAEYEDLVLSNNLYYDNIMSNVDIQEIERIAVVELGMSLAEAGQIVTYSGDIEDYVKQYSDLPTP